MLFSFHRKDGFIPSPCSTSRPSTSHLKSYLNNSSYSSSKRPGTATVRTESTEASDHNFSKNDSIKDDHFSSNKKRPLKFLKILDSMKIQTKTTSPDQFRSYCSSIGTSPKSNPSKESLFFSPRATHLPLDARLKLRDSLRKSNKQIKFLEFMEQQSKGEIKAPLSIRNSQTTKDRVSSTSQDNFKNTQQTVTSQVSRKKFLESAFKIQKEALSKYLIGQPVEKKIIDTHQDLINPINYSIYLQKLKNKEGKRINNTTNSPSTDNESPSTPIIMFKKQLNPDQHHASTYNSKSVFLKQDDNLYFQKLEQLQTTAEKDFLDILSIRQKYQFENIIPPDQQFMGKNIDLKIPEAKSNLKDQLHRLEQTRQESQKSVLKNIRNFLSDKQKERENSKVATMNSFSQKSNDQLNSPPSEINKSLILTSLKQHKKQLSKKIEKTNVNKFANLLKIAILKTEQIDQNLETDSVTEEDEIIITNKIIPNVEIKTSFVDKIMDHFISEQEIEFKKAKNDIPFMALLNGIFTTFLSKNSVLKETIRLIKSTGDPLNPDERAIFDLVKTNNLEQLKIKLLKNHSIVNRQDETGKSLLHWAAVRGQYEIVKLLISLNVDLNLLDVRYRTAKCLALEYKHFQILGMLSQEMKYQKSINQQGSLSDRKDYIQSIVTKL